MLRNAISNFTVVGLFFVAQVASAADQPIQIDETTAQAIARELAPALKQLTEEVMLFHWVPREKAHFPKAMNPSDSLGRDYAAARIRNVFDEPYATPDVMGPGLYLANDPLTTRSYGSPDFGMIAITFMKGTRFLDARSKYPLSANTIELMKKYGCNASSFRRVFQVTSCKQVLRRALEIQAVQLVAYSFAEEKFKNCETGRSDAAFLAISPQVLQNPLISATADLPTSDPAADSARDARKEINEVFASKIPDHRSPLWPQVQERPSEDEFKTWVHAHIFGCGPESDFSEAALSLQ